MNIHPSDPSYVEMLGLELSDQSLEAYLKPSHGKPTMSDEDMKLCIVSLKLALEKQILLNQSLGSRLKKIEDKKFNFRFWKK